MARISKEKRLLGGSFGELLDVIVQIKCCIEALNCSVQGGVLQKNAAKAKVQDGLRLSIAKILENMANVHGRPQLNDRK